MPPAVTVLRVNTVLYCRRFAETRAFYRERLGLETTFESDWFVEFALCEGARLSVADERRASVKSASGAGLTVTLQVADADAAHAALRARGLDPEPVVDHAWGARLFRVRDPENNRVELWSERA